MCEELRVSGNPVQRIDTHAWDASIPQGCIDTSQLHLRNEEDLDIVSMGREDGIDTVVRIDTPIDTFGPYGSKFLSSLGKEICTQTYRYGVETVSIRSTVTFENVSIRWEERIDT